MQTPFLTLKDLLENTNVPWGSFSHIPHEQGFYLVFDRTGDLIYIGKGYGDERVKSHFDPADSEEYFDDACYWFWYRTDDECRAKAYEMAIFNAAKRVGKVLKYNMKQPEGCGDSELAQQANKEAEKDCAAFLRTITVKRLMTKDLYGLAKLVSEF